MEGEVRRAAGAVERRNGFGAAGGAAEAEQALVVADEERRCCERRIVEEEARVEEIRQEAKVWKKLVERELDEKLKDQRLQHAQQTRAFKLEFSELLYGARSTTCVLPEDVAERPVACSAGVVYSRTLHRERRLRRAISA